MAYEASRPERAWRTELAPPLLPQLLLEPLRLLAVALHQPLDVGLEPAHCRLLDLLRLVRRPLVPPRALRLRPQRKRDLVQLYAGMTGAG